MPLIATFAISQPLYRGHFVSDLNLKCDIKLRSEAKRLNCKSVTEAVECSQVSLPPTLNDVFLFYEITDSATGRLRYWFMKLQNTPAKVSRLEHFLTT